MTKTKRQDTTLGGGGQLVRWTKRRQRREVWRQDCISLNASSWSSTCGGGVQWLYISIIIIIVVLTCLLLLVLLVSILKQILHIYQFNPLFIL